MSGGHFNYQQYIIGEIADDIKKLIATNNDESLNEYGEKIGRFYSEETIAQFENGEKLLRAAAIYVQRIDWLISGDDSESSFHATLNRELFNEAKK
jgi:hypothetical protein